MNYFDKDGIILGAYGSEIENPLMFTALLLHLGGDFGKLPRKIKNFSHDEVTAYLSLDGKKLPWKMWLAYLRNFPGLIRDISFFLACRFPKACWVFRIPLAGFMIWTQLPHEERTVFPVRWWIQLTQKYQHTVKLDDGGERHFYTNDKNWEWHPQSMSGKLLNILRVSRLQMGITAKILDWLSLKFLKTNEYKRVAGVGDVFEFNMSCLDVFTTIYFKNDMQHPIVKSSIGKTYRSLVNG